MKKTRLISIGLILCAYGCGTKNDGSDKEYCVPGGTAQVLPETAREYVAMCEPELGVPPQVDCSAGVTVPVTVNGVEVAELLPNFECDNPGLQAGACVPGSTINRFTGRTRAGVERPEVSWVHFCRSEDGESKGTQGTPVWEKIFTGAQMIGYNSETGATCFFELNYGSQDQWVGLDENNRAAGLLPNYDEPEFDQAYIPGDQCNACHQNDPFAHNPWIDAARLPSNPNESVLPAVVANAPYYVVGGSNWDMRTVHIEGNACLSCHRAPMALDALYGSLGFDANQWMPIHSPGSLAGDYAALLDCVENGPENTAGCDWVLPPGGGCEGGSVGSDYPNAGDEDDDKIDGSYDDDDDDDYPPCPDDFNPEPGSACEGSWQSTICELDGVLWWCDDGVWMNSKDKE